MNKSTQKTESAEFLLERAGLRRTPGRVALLNLLRVSTSPLSQQEICRLLTGININGVSVYRSLNAFLRAGIVHRLTGGDRTWRFVLCTCGHCGCGHPHFVCRKCGKVECLKGYALPKIGELQRGYVVEEQEVYLHGLCAGCSI